MPIRPIPDADHFVRHIPGRLVNRRNGVVVGCFPQAYELRSGEDYLSGSWLEHFNPPRETQLSGVLLEVKGYPRAIKRRDAFGVSQVARLKECGAQRSMRLRVLHEPSTANPVAPAYAALRGIRREDQDICGLLAAALVTRAIDVTDIEAGAARNIHPSTPSSE